MRDRNALISRLTRRISRGLKQAGAGGLSRSEMEELAEDTLRSKGWRLDRIEKGRGGRWQVRSRKQRVGSVAVATWFMLDEGGRPSDVTGRASDASGTVIAMGRMAGLVRPREVASRLSEQIEEHEGYG